MPELMGPEFLKRRLAVKQVRVNMRYKYYEMKNRVKDFNITIPAKWSWLTASLGWCAKSVDSVADRLVFRGFSGDMFKLNDIYAANASDVLFDSAILSAMISSCCFIYIGRDDNGFPKMQVIDGGNATGVIDPITLMLKEGYAVLDRDPEKGDPTLEAYFEPGRTTFFLDGKVAEVSDYPTSYPLLVPIINRPDARRPFGHSRITRACIDIQQAALRTLKRSEVSAEFYSYPQRYITGMDSEAAEMDKWRMVVSAYLRIDKDDQGDKPQVGQFPQISMGPFIDQMRMYAALFAGETGLTMDDLGFVSDNPSSNEAIRAAHENLRLTARKAQRTFGVGFLNAGFLAACVRDGRGYLRSGMTVEKPLWAPVFEPDAATLSATGDGIIKVNQAVEGYFGKNNLVDMLGIEPEE